MTKRINQSAIAEASGVSVSTVSRVLARAPGISDTVRTKVLRVARDLGYRPAEGLDPASIPVSRVVLFIAAPQSAAGINTVYTDMIASIRAVADTLGIAVRFALRDPDGSIPEHIVAEAGSGFLFLGIDPEPALLRRLADRKAPVVLVNGIDLDMAVDAVGPDNFAGGRLAARHLVEAGHRRILYLTSTGRWTLQRRSEGFRAGLAEFGGDAVSCETVELARLEEQSVYEAAPCWLDPAKPRPDAIFCGNDLVAVAAVQVLRAAGLSVPQDVSVMGFDDLPVAELSDPPLSTIRVDWRAIGAEAMRVLALRRADPDSPARQTQLGVSLLLRSSTQDR